jgi:hypothetical protein
VTEFNKGIASTLIAEHYFIALFLILMSVFAPSEELSGKMGVLMLQFLGCVM